MKSKVVLTLTVTALIVLCILNWKQLYITLGYYLLINQAEEHILYATPQEVVIGNQQHANVTTITLPGLDLDVPNGHVLSNSTSTNGMTRVWNDSQSKSVLVIDETKYSVLEDILTNRCTTFVLSATSKLDRPFVSVPGFQTVVNTTPDDFKLTGSVGEKAYISTLLCIKDAIFHSVTDRIEMFEANSGMTVYSWGQHAQVIGSDTSYRVSIRGYTESEVRQILQSVE